MMDRRAFLGTITAGTLLAQRLAYAEDKIDKIGLQLYTVRDNMEQDPEATVAKVASIGYKEVELAGFDQASDGKVTYFKRSPADIHKMLAKNGLAAPSTHVSYKSLEPNNFTAVIDSSKVLGNKFIVNPWIDEEVRNQPDGWKRAAETFNRTGATCKKNGIQFAYHNHWFEFLPVDGKLPYDTLLAETDPKLVKMELDMCWITVANQNPIKYFEQYPGRFPLVHLKDVKEIPQITAAGAQNFGDTFEGITEVGSGIIPWKDLLAFSQKAGIKHYFVEHDKPKSPFESIQTSYNYLEKLRF